MICKYCQAELDEGNMICPVCGKDNECTETETEKLCCPKEADAGNKKPKTIKKSSSKKWKIALSVVCCVILLFALAVVVLTELGIKFGPRENDVYYKDSYTVSDKTAIRKADKVVARVGDRVLTNAQLQLLLCMQVEDFLQYNGTYYFDMSKPLDEQYVSKDSDVTWEQYFIEATLETWYRYQILFLLAQERDEDVLADYRDVLDKIPQQLKDMADKNGFESVDEMIKADMGAACKPEHFYEYVELSNTATLFLDVVYAENMPSMEDVEKYYQEHEEEFKTAQVDKKSGFLVDVRHILIQLDDPEAKTDGSVSYTDAQWQECRQKAADILNQWRAGKADEASFAELANKHSKDGGSNTNGGLYTRVSKDTMVEEFDAWIFDEKREPGDTGLVKTKFGYHIMYFSGSEEKWITAARSSILSELVEEMIEEAQTQWTMAVDYKNIALTSIER